MSDVATEGAEATPESTQDAPAGGLDLGPVLERLDELGPRVERMDQRFTEYLQGEEPEDTEEPFDFASLFGDDPVQGQEAEQQQLNPERLQEFIAAQIQRGIDERVNPINESVQGLQMRHEAAELVGRYPDMDNPEIAGPVLKEAEQRAQAMGQPGLATNMKFIETVYEAQMARKYAAGEVPVGGTQDFEAERAGGAGPAAADAPNIAERIIQSRQQQSGWRDLLG